MTTFLKSVSDAIYQSHSAELDQITIIIPNRRAAVYIQSHLAKLHQGPFFAPKISTMNEWVESQTKEQILTQTEMLFLLYNIHLKIEKQQAETFDLFLKWGKLILNDFDEIDRYHITPKAIFRDLKNMKDIDNWSFDSVDQLSEGQKRFQTLWDKLPLYYEHLRTELEQMNAINQGFAYQQLANRLSVLKPEGVKQYYFVGFNALSKAEQLIIEHLKNHQLATVFFDVDAHYVNNPEHEAGHFYRQLKREWHLKEDLPHHIGSQKKSIQIIETAQQVVQAKIAGQIVQNIPEDELSKTAIVLADESLMIPLSRSLPADLPQANMTMGYPIKYTHLKSLMDLIFEFQHNFTRFKNEKLYHKTLLKFLDHTFIQWMCHSELTLAEYEKDLVANNRVYIQLDELLEVFPALEAIHLVFKHWADASEGFDALDQLVDGLYQSFKQSEGHELELEILYHFTKGMNRFKKIWNRYPHPLELKSFQRLFQQFWQNESLSFLGNPVEGLQIMGILETRTLDFEHLIVLSMNEGHMPKANINQSLIPRELKLFHHLPTEVDRDAIFAHHFYRLLHQAKQVYLTHNSNPEAFGRSEKSRFIIQIENEFKPYGHDIKSFTYTPKDEASDISEVSYKVTPKVHQRLDELFEKGLSPSALNTFARCPLDFYYTYIMKLREADNVEETIESSTFGTMIHNVLEELFKEAFLENNMALNASVLLSEKKKVRERLMSEYLKVFKAEDIKYGQNKLSFEVSVGFLEDLIDQQIKEISSVDFPIYIKELEESIEANYEWEIHGEKKQIKIKGMADRIEQFGASFRIIDYKTGKCDDEKINVSKSWLDTQQMNVLMTHNKKAYARQLLMYALMFRQQFPQRHTFTAGIISMIHIKDWVQNVYLKERSQTDVDRTLSQELLDAFEQALQQTIEQMYDPDFIFAHNPDSKYCEYCGK